MAMKLIDETKEVACRTAEADAIRAKTGGTATIPYDFQNGKGFADAIAGIPSGGSNVHKWVGDIEYVNQDVASAVIPIDTSGYDYFAVNFLIVKTGVVSGGEVQYDEDMRVWASGVVAFEYSGSNFPVEQVKLLRDATNYTSTTPYNCAYSYTYAGGNFSNVGIANGLRIDENGVSLGLVNSGRKFARAGYYYKFHYTVYGVKVVTE